MQPYFFAYIGYFQLLFAADKFIILDDVNFINKGWINRNNILINNKPGLFSIPLVKSSQNKLIKDIDISYENNADRQKKFLKTIERSYSKAPYYKEISDILSKLILSNEIKISGLIYKSLIEIKNYLGFETDIIESSEIYSNSELKGEERILDICRRENATQYLNLSGGIELYSKDSFDDNNIKLNFIRTKNIIYKQFTNEFTDSLSMIDVLMFNSKDKIREYLYEYELI